MCCNRKTPWPWLGRLYSLISLFQGVDSPPKPTSKKINGLLTQNSLQKKERLGPFSEKPAEIRPTPPPTPLHPSQELEAVSVHLHVRQLRRLRARRRGLHQGHQAPLGRPGRVRGSLGLGVWGRCQRLGRVVQLTQVLNTEP